MGFFDMFDKLDDIVYKPVETLCDWIEEPLRKWEHGRNMNANEHAAQIEKEIHEFDAKLEMEREKNAAEMQFQRQKWDVEINEMIAEQEDLRRDKLVEAIKNYQIQLASASRDIVESIGKMSLNLRCKANDLVLEKMQAYKKIQDEAKLQCRKELQEVKDDFLESDPDTYHIMVDEIIQERRSMIETAGRFIDELSEDLKRLNENTDILMRQGMNTVERYLRPVADAMGVAVNVNADNAKMIENAEVVEKDVIETNFAEYNLYEKEIKKDTF